MKIIHVRLDYKRHFRSEHAPRWWHNYPSEAPTLVLVFCEPEITARNRAALYGVTLIEFVIE